MSIRTKIDFSGITSDNIVTSDNKKYIREDDEIFNSLKDEIAACENAQVQTEIATLQILDIKEQTKVIANEAIDTATERAETAAENAETAQALAETAAINALEAERNVTEFSESFAKLDRDNTFSGNIIFEKIDTEFRSIGFNRTEGANAIFYTTTNEDDSLKGRFTIAAQKDENNAKYLVGKPDGTLTWDGKNVLTEESAAVVTGEIKWFSGSTTPAGYLACNGAKVSRTTYANLFAVIGTKWGTGDGSTTFTLPNLIGRVPWGATTAGTYKEAGLPNITGTGHADYSGDNGGTKKVAGAFYNASQSTQVYHWPNGWYGASTLMMDASRSNAIYGKSTTVQPPAATLIPIIKY